MMKKFYLLSILIGIILTACGKKQDVTSVKPSETTTPAAEENVLRTSEGKWNEENKIVVKNKGIRFFAYISKDNSESWIYKVKPTDHFSDTKIVFPEKINEAIVTKVGGPSDVDENEILYDIWGRIFEPYHNFSNGDPTDKGIKRIELPDTVETITAGTFGGLIHLEEIELPSALQKIDCALFYDCRSLTTISIGSKLETIEKNSYGTFEKYDNLKQFIVSEENEKYSSSNGMIVSKDKKRLILVPPALVKVDVSEEIETIEKSAFLRKSKVNEIHISKGVKEIQESAIRGKKIEKMNIEKENPYIGVANNCLYEKNTGKLLCVIATQVVEFPDGVTNIAAGFTTVGKSSVIKRIIIPKTIKTIEDGFLNYGNLYENQSKLELEFQSENPPNLDKDMSWPLSLKLELYVPEKSESVYKDWLKEMNGIDKDNRELIKVKTM